MPPNNQLPVVAGSAGLAGPVTPLDLEATKAAMELYQAGVEALLSPGDYQTFPTKNGEGRFKKRSGWRKLALYFNLNTEYVGEPEVARDRDGHVIRARVRARATAPSGRFAEGLGACGIDEGRPFNKPEHDIPATAATRALNRAISDLVAAGEVSAEEVEAETTDVASDELVRDTYAALASMGVEGGDEFMRLLKRRFDERLPTPAVVALKSLAWWTAKHPSSGPAEQSADVVPVAIAETIDVVQATVHDIDTPPEPQVTPEQEPTQ